MPKKEMSKGQSIQRTKTIADIILSAAVLVLCGAFVKGIADRAVTVPKSQYVSIDTDIDVPEVPTEPIDPDKLIFTSQAFPTTDKFYGDLILVNNEHQYFATGDEDLVSIMEMNDETGRDFFTSVDYSYTILSQVYEPMAQMISDFYDLYYNDTLIIYGSYRTTEFQQQLYEEDLAANGSEESTKVAKPGFSEHETGLAFDFSETVNYDYDGDGDFAWINENCYKYGFIVRYTEDKEDITEIQYEPWHFRYVGIPHAYYITKNKLVLEEYIELLSREHAYDQEHLEFADEEGNNYEIYFYKSDDGSETTSVPVPSGVKYDISGNNVDGFIVTVYKDQKVAVGQEHPTEAASEAAGDAESDDTAAEPTDEEAEDSSEE